MKLIIDIPDEDYKKINSKEKIITISCDIASAIKNGTPIPDNATNGDVIHGLYMPYGYVVNDDYDEVVISAEGVDMRFSKTWWNAPYQKGGKE